MIQAVLVDHLFQFQAQLRPSDLLATADSVSSRSGTLPTSEQLTDTQQATGYVHQTLAVRAALLGDDKARRCILAMLLHEKVRDDGLTVRHERDVIEAFMATSEGFDSPNATTLRERAAVDPFGGVGHVETVEAFRALMAMGDAQLDELIAVLTVRCVTSNLHRHTALIATLADELDVDVREHWRPDAAWFNGYRKAQLADLLGRLLGEKYDTALALKRKKSELLARCDGLFKDAAEGRLDNDELARRVNAWLPSNLLPQDDGDVDDESTPAVAAA